MEILRLLRASDTSEEVVKRIMEIISNIHQQPRMQEHMVKMIIEVLTKDKYATENLMLDNVQI